MFSRWIAILVLLKLCFAHPHAQADSLSEEASKGKAKAPKVFLANLSESTSPTAQILVPNLYGVTTEPLRIVMSLWEDGRIVWSLNTKRGGEPYKQAKIPSTEVTRILQLVKDENLFVAPREYMLIIPDRSPAAIYVRSGTMELYLQSGHQSVNLEHYKNTPGLNEFIAHWDRVKQILLSAIPENGENVKSLDLLAEDFDRKTGQRLKSRKLKPISQRLGPPPHTSAGGSLDKAHSSTTSTLKTN